MATDRKSKLRIETVTDDHVALTTQSWWQAFRIHLRLRVGYGFQRDGKTVGSIDEWISGDYVRGNIRILAGWDNWMSYHFFSQDQESDVFLKSLYRELSK